MQTDAFESEVICILKRNSEVNSWSLYKLKYEILIDIFSSYSSCVTD